jgi:hypothetical protein
MMENNWQRLNIWLQCSNRFDYTEYAAACRVAGCEPQLALEFAQKAGMVSCGTVDYPDIPVSEAYLKFISGNQISSAPPEQGTTTTNSQPVMKEVDVQFPDGHTEKRMVPVDNSTTGCSTCGGGKVL